MPWVRPEQALLYLFGFQLCVCSTALARLSMYLFIYCCPSLAVMQQTVEQHSIFISVPDISLFSLQRPRSGKSQPVATTGVLACPCRGTRALQPRTSGIRGNVGCGVCSKRAALSPARRHSTGNSCLHTRTLTN